MAIQQVNLGTYANDGAGDDLRTAFNKVNSNFSELDNLTIVGGTNLGAGSPVFASVVADSGTGSKLSFRSLVAGTNIAVTNNSDTITFTTTGTITANLTGNVTGNVTGNLTGNVTGNVTGNLTGNVTGQVSDITNHALSELSDVSNLSPVNGQFLRYNTGLWSYTAIDTNMVSEGVSNLYFTPYRARESISVSGDLSYNSITGVLSYTMPTLSIVATSGSYSDLINKPSLFSGNYNDLTNKPSLSTVATSGSYSDLINKPSLFSGNYDDLNNKPDLSVYATVTSVNTAIANLVDSAPGALDTLNELAAALNDDSSFATTINNQLSLKANTSSLHAVATSGNYNDLINKPIIPGSSTNFNLGPIANQTITNIFDLLLYTSKIDLGTITSPAPVNYNAGSLV